MDNLPPLLFSELSIFNVLENQKGGLKKRVRTLGRKELEHTDDKLIGGLLEDFGVIVPVLNEAGIYVTEREIQADVSRDPMRMIFDRSQPFYIPANEITVHIPFEGESIFFRVQPSSFTLNPPRAFVDDAELRIVYEVTNPQFNLKNEYESRLRQIKQHLESLRESSKILEGELKSLARLGLVERRQQLEANAGLVGSLGLPVRSPMAPQESVSSPSRPDVSKEHQRKRSDSSWDVFISHASEDKSEIAAPLAHGLKALGLRVWYDEFSLSLGDSLREAIDRGLSGSKYGVVVLSENFFAKHWPQQELNGLATREVDGKRVILPVWHNLTFERVRAFSPTLADRVAAKSTDGLDAVISRIASVILPRP